MHYRTIQSNFYCGVDIHPKKSHLCILDNNGKKHLSKNIINDFTDFKRILKPFLPDIVVGCESTYSYFDRTGDCSDAGNGTGYSSLR